MSNLLVSTLFAFQYKTFQGTDFYRIEGDLKTAKLRLLDQFGIRFDHEFSGFFCPQGKLLGIVIDDGSDRILAMGNL